LCEDAGKAQILGASWPWISGELSLRKATDMTIPQPHFMLIDDCPGWCTFDHDKLRCEPGDHEPTLVLVGDNGRIEDNRQIDAVDFYASADLGSRSVTIEGDEVVRMSLDEAPERLLRIARTMLTAVYRLGVIKAAEEGVTEAGREGVSYGLEFGPDLLTLVEAVRLLGGDDLARIERNAFDIAVDAAKEGLV
jgi:hypothetical protein